MLLDVAKFIWPLSNVGLPGVVEPTCQVPRVTTTEEKERVSYIKWNQLLYEFRLTFLAMAILLGTHEYFVLITFHTRWWARRPVLHNLVDLIFWGSSMICFQNSKVFVAQLSFHSLHTVHTFKPGVTAKFLALPNLLCISAFFHLGGTRILRGFSQTQSLIRIVPPSSFYHFFFALGSYHIEFQGVEKHLRQ